MKCTAPLSKKAIIKFAAGWDMASCPLCKTLVPLKKGQSIKDTDHWNKNHAPAGSVDPGFRAIEEFQPEDQPDGERSGKLCPKCQKNGHDYELTYYDDYNPKKGLWPYYQCEHCGFWEDEGVDIDTAPQGNVELFKDCPKCGAEMDVFDAEQNEYWVCENCGHNEKIEDKSTPKSPGWLQNYLKNPAGGKFYTGIKDVVFNYKNRTSVEADQITPNIWLGDVANGWFMRDQNTGKPFDAILNVSQHTYTPPPDVEYAHIPIDEYGRGKDANERRIRDLTKASDLLARWVDEGKKVYLHCSEGMNRSPSVLAAYLYKEMMQGGLAKNEDEKEALYEMVTEDINKKRFVAMPYGEMEDSLREYLGLPNYPVTQYKPLTSGGWFGGKGKKKSMFSIGELVHWTDPQGKTRTGTIISTPQQDTGHSDIYWIKTQDTGMVAMVSEKLLRRKKNQPQTRYYPGDKGLMQTFPRFPPAGGVQKKPKKKKKKALSKKASAGFVRRGGHNIIANFLRRAISQDEMYNFYCVMQLPPAFFAAFPKWNVYAKRIVETVSAEYAKYLEQLVRTEAEATWSVKGGDDEESRHEHEWESYNDESHQCSDCGYTESHYGWDDTDETGHTCEACGTGAPHEFDHDHDCEICGGSYDHNWKLTGDQEFECGEDENGNSGCGATTEFIPEDESTPFYGDFNQERHQHNFLSFPTEGWQHGDDGYRCNLCGRAFIDETGEEQEQLPGITKQKVNEQSKSYLYHQNITQQKEKIRMEHEANPSLHVWKFVKTDTWGSWDAKKQEYIPLSYYECEGCHEDIRLRPGDQLPGSSQTAQEPTRKGPEWKSVVAEGTCPECSKNFLDPVKLINTGEALVCPNCYRSWDYNGTPKHRQPRPTQGNFLSLRQLIAAQPMPYKEMAPINIDTSKWFDFYVQDPERGEWIPWSELRSKYRPSEWRSFERSIIDNPESVLTYLSASPKGKGLVEHIDDRKLEQFKFLVQLKKHLQYTQESEIASALDRFKKYPEYVRSDSDEIFESIFGLKALYDEKQPDEDDSRVYQETKPEIASAWKRYLKVLKDFDPEAAEFYERYKEPPQPEWAGQAEALTNRITIANGTGTSPGIASGMVAITAAMALEMAGQGPVILVRPETTPEDIAAMRAAAGFLTAHGGPTAHAAIVARQMGKPCVTGAGFTVNNDVVTFPGGRTLEVGKRVTIDGRTGAISVSEQAEEAAPGVIEQKHVEPIQPGENWDDEFEKLLALDQYMKKSKDPNYSYEDLQSMDLTDVAQAFNTSLASGAYGGKPWALASIRAKQLQEAIGMDMPWKYRGMIVDQINTLQHNTGNIFQNKPWPGKPSRWINDVLDTKGSEHAMYWIENMKDEFNGTPMLTDETRQMLRDYRLWARREGYPSLYGTDISHMTPDQLQHLQEKEKRDVRYRREQESEKWARSPIMIIKRGNTITALHKVSGARLVFYAGDTSGMHSLHIPDQWKSKGIARWLADSIKSVL